MTVVGFLGLMIWAFVFSFFLGLVIWAFVFSFFWIRDR